MTGESMHDLIVIDAAAAVILALLASLSGRLGEALKIRPYFKLFYVCIVLVLAGSLIHVVSSGFDETLPELIALGLRCCAGCIAVAVCLRYWRWLFSECAKK